jgi:hypothetical protein
MKIKKIKKNNVRKVKATSVPNVRAVVTEKVLILNPKSENYQIKE